MTRSVGNSVKTVGAPTLRIFQAGESGIYSSPPGCTYIMVEMIGGGGGGGWLVTNGIGGGGGSAGYLKTKFPPQTSSNYSVGLGGVAGSALNGGNGAQGGNTRFGPAISRGGGFGRNDGGGGEAPNMTIATASTVIYQIRGNVGGSLIAPFFYTAGGGSFLGPPMSVGESQSNPIPPVASGYGSGGVGSNGDLPSPAQNGGPGILVITEYY